MAYVDLHEIWLNEVYLILMSLYPGEVIDFSKIQLVVYHQCCVLIG